ncbi:YcxB family protein [Acidovorax sp. DW039]|uniref:YcxB family protein n=1 Tax=Acidovorax sp. DW039 TaxID=3095606 RepID=UPI00308A417C|nr:YcxB family protein [Acidovorax sp. DW039]
MSLHAELHYDKALVQSAVGVYWRRTVGRRLPWVCLAMAVFLVYLLARGQRGWQEGMIGTVLFFGCAMMVAVYTVHYRNALAKLRAMRQPVAQLRVDEANLTVESGAGKASLPWTAVEQVWRCDGFWLLLLSPAQFITLPTARIAQDMQDFMLARLTAAGAQVR